MNPSRTRLAPRGQAAVLMAVVIALLFSLFMLVFEVGRLLIAREVIISASRRAGEAGLSYMVDYARNRSDWDRTVLNATRNIQVWAPFYDETTGIPSFVRKQIYHYLQINLADAQAFVPQAQIDKITMEGIGFPYKEPNWPTSTIGARLRITVNVPLMLLGGLAPTVPITVDTLSITSIEEILGISNNGPNAYGAGGASSEFTGVARPIPGSTKGWYEPFLHFNESRYKLINQWWGCPTEPVSAYAYAFGRHAGMDFGVPEATQLFAVAHGRIISVGPYPNQKDPRVGNMSVILETDDGIRITYLHMLDIAVRIAQEVDPGQLLGTSDGDPKRGAFAGFSTGAHLHFQVAEGGPKSGINFDFPFDKDPAPLLGLVDNPKSRPPTGPKGECVYGK